MREFFGELRERLSRRSPHDMAIEIADSLISVGHQCEGVLPDGRRFRAAVNNQNEVPRASELKSPVDLLKITVYPDPLKGNPFSNIVEHYMGEPHDLFYWEGTPTSVVRMDTMSGTPKEVLKRAIPILKGVNRALRSAA